MPDYCFYCMKQLESAAFCPRCGHKTADKAAETPYHLIPGTMLAERYLVGKYIGEGGFGITYIGLDTILSKRVAIKEFYPAGAANRTNTVSEGVIITKGKEDFFNKGVERFMMEAKSVAAFSDEDGIVDVLDYFQANNTAYIVMEYLEGETLKDHIGDHGLFDSAELIALTLPVMRSLKAMHAKGVIHRDISPDNIMYTKNGKLKLMDFGSARYYTNENRELSVVLKQGFAPEEQYRKNGRQGPFTDVYALCATIYCCITGKIPEDSLDRQMNDTLQPPSALGVTISPQHEAALMHGLALRSEDRCQDMDTLIHEFTDTRNIYSSTGSANHAQKPAQQRPQQRPPQQNRPQQRPPQQRPPQHNMPPMNRPPMAPPYGQPNYQQPKKNNTPVIIAVIIAAAAVLIAGGIMAFVLLRNDSGSSDTDTTGATSASDSTTPTQSNPSESTTATTQTEPTTETPPTSTVPTTTVPPTTNYSKDEIDSISHDIGENFTDFITDKDDAFWYEKDNHVLGRFVYTESSKNHMWIATPNNTMLEETHQPDGLKYTWYYYDSSGKVYFILDCSGSTHYRVYVKNNQAVRCQVGESPSQDDYYMNDSGFPSSKCNQLISDANSAYNYVQTNR